ncbi:MAG: L-arabinose isomerase family protein [Bacteroidota bacterium]
MKKTRIRVVFTGLKKNIPAWPYINYDVEKRSREIMNMLQEALPDVDFSGVVYFSREEAEKGYEKDEKGNYDGWLVYIATIWTGIPEFYAEHVKPVVISDELFSGSGEFIRTRSLIERKKLPVATVSSSDFKDTVNAVKLLDVMAKLQESKVLIISNDMNAWGATPDKVEATRKIFGTEVIRKSGKDLQQVYETISDKQAEPIAAQWMKGAKKIIEPTKEEIHRSAKMYLALKKIIEETGADAVSTDCLGLFNAGDVKAYPCLAFFQLNNDGKTGVCEGDLRATLSQLMFRYLSNKPAYISDPVFDESKGQIIYAHCVSTTKPFGTTGACCSYVIRSHVEDNMGASVQAILPIGETVTTLAISPVDKAMGLHTAKTIANETREEGCRTKLVAEVDVEKVLANYHEEYFGWHQVSCYGNYRKSIKHLATLYGLKLIEQDK